MARASELDGLLLLVLYTVDAGPKKSILSRAQTLKLGFDFFLWLGKVGRRACMQADKKSITWLQLLHETNPAAGGKRSQKVPTMLYYFFLLLLLLLLLFPTRRRSKEKVF